MAEAHNYISPHSRDHVRQGMMRFVEREVVAYEEGPFKSKVTVRILQHALYDPDLRQWYWEDVPLEEEFGG